MKRFKISRVYTGKQSGHGLDAMIISAKTLREACHKYTGIFVLGINETLRCEELRDEKT